MRACLAMLLLFLLGAYPVLASTFDSARGGPFDQVPAGDPAYDDCRYLAQCGVIDARPPGDFAGANPLARYDFSLSLVHPLSALEALATDSRRAGAGLEPVLDMSPAERARVGGILARLLDEFRDVLSVLGKDVSQAIRGARLMADGGYTPRAAAPAPENAAGVTFESSRARVGVIYRAAEGRAAALPPVPLGGLADAPITGLAAARLPVSRAAPASLAPRDDALTDFSLHRLRGSFEYGVTDNLSLAVAYEAAVRQGAGTTILDAASLKTLGLGYRFSPSTSVNLKYHLIDYADHTGAGARLEDRMAETDLVVRF